MKKNVSCSVSHWVAVCCFSVFLQCVFAVCCCSVLQCVAACCSVLQRVAVWCSGEMKKNVSCSVSQRVAMCCCNVLLQCVVAVQCSVLHLIAAYCSLLQCEMLGLSCQIRTWDDAGLLKRYQEERWGAGVETQKNVLGVFGGWGRVPFNEPYAPSLSTIYDGA